MNWTEKLSEWPHGRYVESQTADGWFVEVGLVGKIISRHQAYDELMLKIEWSNSTISVVNIDTLVLLPFSFDPRAVA